MPTSADLTIHYGFPPSHADDSELAELREALATAYLDEPFVRVLGASDGLPSTGHVARSNRAHIGVVELPEQDIAVVVSVEDNLVKGASGQAVQNWNALSGFPETLGLVP